MVLVGFFELAFYCGSILCLFFIVDVAADFCSEPVENDTIIFEDSPSVDDDQMLVSSGKKRRVGNSPRTTNPVKVESKSAVARASKDPPSQSKSAELAERKLSLEEKKVRLAEKRFFLEEKKLEATIEIGKGLIASMERMTQTISSMGAFTSNTK